MRIFILALLAIFGTMPASAETAEELVATTEDRNFIRLLSINPASVSPSATPPQLAAMVVKRSAEAAPDNLGELPNHIFHGAELSSPEQYAYLERALDVELVVNLTEVPDDAEVCRANGLQCIQFPIRLSWPIVTNIDWTILRQAFEFILEAQRQGRSVYFHCQYGADRTGALAAALTVRREACGKNFSKELLWDQVETDLKRHHFHSTWFPNLGRDIKALVYEFDRNESWLCQ